MASIALLLEGFARKIYGELPFVDWIYLTLSIHYKNYEFHLGTGSKRSVEIARVNSVSE